MIKKLQALRAKKGFTLVELVVVIAIIGVLAAILVPTMIGVVQDSRITSANSTASQIKTQATTWLTKMDSLKRGIKQARSDEPTELSATVSGAAWEVTDPGIDFQTSGAEGAKNPQWTSAGDGDSADTTYSFADFMSDSLRDLKDATVRIYIQNGAVVGVLVVDGDSDAGDDIAEVSADWDAQTGSFEGKAGIVSTGAIVGSNPQLQMAA